MTEATLHTPLTRLNKDLGLGPVELTVADLKRSLTYYTQALGLTLLSREGAVARLGVADRTLLVLNEIPGAPPAPRTSPGLYHFALLLPTRADLGRFVRHYASLGLRLGQGDHWVSEAFYTNDPDGHGIEVYRDRPRSEWKWNLDQVQMGSDPIDIESLLAEPGAELPFTGLPDGTVMGHVHLKVTDVETTEAFYRGVLGFDVVSRWSGQALFISVGGYHHHLGLNAWQSAGGAAAPKGTAGLVGADLILPQPSDVEAVARNLDAAHHPYELQSGVLSVRDPSGNLLRFAASAH